MPRVNPEILVWARTTAALGVEEAARKLRLGDSKSTTAAEKLRALESGDREPSRTTLRHLETLYRRPLLTFYLGRPPASHPRPADFRSRRNRPSPRATARLDALLRDLQMRQSVLREALRDDEETTRLEFIGSCRQEDGWRTVLEAVHEVVRVGRRRFRCEGDLPTGFGLLREEVESAGVFVLLRSDLGNYRTRLDPTLFRGLAISDGSAPFLVVNDRQPPPARSLTLLHEVVHLLLGQTCHCGVPAENAVERFCDRVAGEFLPSSGELDRKKRRRTDLRVGSAANRRSRLGRRLITEVRRLLEADLLSLREVAQVLGVAPLEVARIVERTKAG